MTRGPAKVSVRIDGDDSAEIAQEALDIYGSLIAAVEKFETTPGG